MTTGAPKQIIDYLVAVIDRLPFPPAARPILDRLRAGLAKLHPSAPYVAGAVLGVISVLLVVWLARLPLRFAWELFGWVSNNSTSRLSVYNTLVQAAAIIVGAKVFFEVARSDR